MRVVDWRFLAVPSATTSILFDECLVWIVRAKLTSFRIFALDCVLAAEERVNFRSTLPVRVAIPHEHSESPHRFDPRTHKALGFIRHFVFNCQIF